MKQVVGRVVLVGAMVIAMVAYLSGASAATQLSTTGVPITDLGPGTAYSINNSGQVVGESSGTAFLWQSGTMQNLGVLPGGTSSAAYSVNNPGQVVGRSTGFDNGHRAFLWENGAMQNLGTLYPGDTYSEARGINSSGQVVGSSGGEDLGTRRAFLWQNGTMQDLGILAGATYSYAAGINGLGQVVGYSGNPGTGFQHAFLWDQGVMSDLGALPPWNTISAAAGVNDLSQVAGTAGVGGGSAGFLWENGVMRAITPVSPSGWGHANANGINNLGQAVGGYTPSGYPDYLRGYLWGVAGGQEYRIDLGALYNERYTWYNTCPFGVNDLGQVVGITEGHAVLWEPIPEPSGLLALGSGLVALGDFLRRRRR